MRWSARCPASNGTRKMAVCREGALCTARNRILARGSLRRLLVVPWSATGSPAGLNNVIGLKPSLGSLSARGVVPACRTVETVSVFALTTADAWAAFEVMADFDADDPWSKPSAGAVSRPLPPAFKVGIPSGASRRFFGDAEQAAAYAAALEAVAALGGDLVELDFAPFYEVGRLLYGGPWIACCYANLVRAHAALGRGDHAYRRIDHMIRSR